VLDQNFLVPPNRSHNRPRTRHRTRSLLVAAYVKVDDDFWDNEIIILPLAPVAAILFFRAGFSDSIAFRVIVLRGSARMGL
jgi:hypothetical protein